MTTYSSISILGTLLLCGMMGLLGQGIRAAVGLKSAATLSAELPPTQQAQFNAAYFGVSLMIGFIAGILAGFGIGIDQLMKFDPANLKTLLGIAVAGYAGADFIENAFTRLIPGLGTVPSPVPGAATGVEPGGGGTISSPIPTTPSALPAGAEVVGLAAALKAIAPKVNTNIWALALSIAFTKYGITTYRQMAAAIGQFLLEAGAAFQETVEKLNYTHAEHLHDVFPHEFPTVKSAESYVRKPDALANHVYANKNGNGDEASGDGYLFRGRGLIQLTGRTEYSQFATSIGKSVDEALTYCETPEGAAMSGCWYLSSRGCLPLADSWLLSEITHRVNGTAMRGNAQRIAYATEMLKALGG